MARRRLLCPRYRLGAPHLGHRVHRLHHHMGESARLMAGSVALGITLVPLTSAVAGIALSSSAQECLSRHLWTSSPCALPWYHSLRPSRALPCHRRHESAWLVTFGLLRPAHCFGASYLGLRVLPLGRCRHEGARLVAGSVALGIALVALTSAGACIVSVAIRVRVLGSSSLDFFAPGIALAAFASHVVGTVSITAGVRVVGLSSAPPPSASP